VGSRIGAGKNNGQSRLVTSEGEMAHFLRHLLHNLGGNATAIQDASGTSWHSEKEVSYPNPVNSLQVYGSAIANVRMANPNNAPYCSHHVLWLN
jgi:hypothetical protein